jgi:hypothetical protein
VPLVSRRWPSRGRVRHCCQWCGRTIIATSFLSGSGAFTWPRRPLTARQSSGYAQALPWQRCWLIGPMTSVLPSQPRLFSALFSSIVANDQLVRCGCGYGRRSRLPPRPTAPLRAARPRSAHPDRIKAQAWIGSGSLQAPPSNVSAIRAMCATI